MSDEKKLSDRLRSYLYSMHPIMLSVSELFRYADEIAALEQRLEAAEAEKQQAIDGETKNPWKSAIINELVVDHIYTVNHETDPRKALADVISWNCRVVLDPSVSKEARDLQQQAIDAAFEHVAGLFDRVGKHDEAGFLRSWRGTNPLAELEKDK